MRPAVGERVDTRRERGSILLMTMWMVVVLAIWASVVTQTTRVEFMAMKRTVQKTRGVAAALRGVMVAAVALREDRADERSRAFDTRYRCGIPDREGVTPEDMFTIPADEGMTVRVAYTVTENDRSQTYAGLQDQERFLAINTLSEETSRILTEVVRERGFSESVAATVTRGVLDWKDADTVTPDEENPTEDAYYAQRGISYRMKNAPIESVEELHMIPGMTDEVYRAIAPYVTVFPSAGSLRVNFDTAPEIVLRALARGFTGAATNTDREDADSLVEKVIDYREGDDGAAFTVDDRVIDAGDVELSAKERALFQTIARFRTQVSDFFMINAEARRGRTVVATIKAIVDSRSMAVVSWRVE